MRYLTVLLTILGVIAAACDGDGATPTPTSPLPPDAAATSAPDGESPFPVVLEHEVLVVSSADGSQTNETPLQPDRLTQRSPYVSPDGSRTAIFRDGELLIQEGAGEPRPVPLIDLPGPVRAAWPEMWSPDGNRLAVLAVDESSDVRPGTLYVVNADGSEQVNVSGGVDASSPIAWSPDSERISFLSLSREIPVGSAGTLYTVRSDGSERTAIGAVPSGPVHGGSNLPRWSPDGSWIAAAGGLVLDATGGPPIQLGASGIQSSWSPDSRSLAVGDAFPGGNVMLVDVASPAEPRFLTEGFWPRWSPDGERVAFKRDGQVYTIRPDGTGLAALGEYGQDDRGELAWSEDGQVQFVRTPGRALHLYAIDLRDGAVTRAPRSITDRADFFPLYLVQLAPGAEQIAYASYGGKEGQEEAGWFTMDIDTGELTLVTDDSRNGVVSWSPDGIRLALQAGAQGVLVAEGDRSPPRRVSEADARVLAWSPDGAYLAIGGESEINVLEVDGNDDQVIDVGPEADGVASIAWSPDGTRLLYVIDHFDSAAGLSTSETFIADLDGSPPRRLFGTESGVSGGLWSPGGETIAYVSDGDVWLMDADGENERRLTGFDPIDFADGVGVGQLHWSPDGSRIALVAGPFPRRDLYVIDVEDGSSLFVATNPANCHLTLLGWSPDSERLFAVPSCDYSGI